MCKRFALDLDWNAIAAQFSVAEEDVRGAVLPRPSYNIAPTQNIAVIAQGKDGHRHLTGAYWSLIPSWSSGKTLPYPTYNARVESAHVKSTFAESTRSRRTIIPASGYYEWRGAAPVLFQPGDGIDGACDGRAVFVAAAFRGIPMAADGDDSHVPCGGWAGDGA